MDSKEINILEVLQDGDKLSQRDIAKRTGMSLGMVNMLLNKCIKKGLIKIEHLNSRSVRYILTPKGIQEKTAKTIEYIKKSYRAIIKISSYIRFLTEEQVGKGKDLWIVGNQDEMFQLISTVLNEMKVKYYSASDINEIRNSKNAIAYLWDASQEEKAHNIDFINIFVEGKNYADKIES